MVRGSKIASYDQYEIE